MVIPWRHTLCGLFVFLVIGSLLYSVLPQFQYYGFPITTLNVWRGLLAIGAVLGLLFLLPRDRTSPGYGFACSFLIFAFFPNAFYFVLSSGSGEFFLFAFLYTAVILCASNATLRLRLVPSVIGSVSLAKAIMVMIAATAIIELFRLNGMPSLAGLEISRVYEIRRGYSSSRILEYLQSATTFCVIPMFIGSATRDNFIRILLATLALVLFIYLSSGGRFLLFATLFLLTLKIYLLSRKTLMTFFLHFTYACVFAWLFDKYILGGANFLSSILLFRSFYVPGWMSNVWAEVFSNIGFLGFSQQLSFFSSPTGSVIPEVFVGDLLFPDDGGSFATTGAIGYSFANAHYLGLLDAAFLGVLLVMFNMCWYQIKQKSLSGGGALFLPAVLYGLYSSASNLYSLLASRAFIVTLILCFLWSLSSNLVQKTQTRAGGRSVTAGH